MRSWRVLVWPICRDQTDVLLCNMRSRLAFSLIFRMWALTEAFAVKLPMVSPRALLSCSIILAAVVVVVT